MPASSTGLDLIRSSSHTDTERETQRHRQREKHTDTHTDTDRHRHRHRHRPLRVTASVSEMPASSTAFTSSDVAVCPPDPHQ
eukprot:3280121-Rhodomonas_salina.1